MSVVSEQPSRRRQVVAIARVVCSLGLIVFVLSRVDVGTLLEYWQRANRGLLLAAVVVQFLGMGVSALKWWLLMRPIDETIPYTWSLRTYFIGAFCNNFLPTMVGGDAVRALGLSQRTNQTVPAIASVLIDRALGFLALTCIGWVAFLGTQPLLAHAPALRFSALLALLIASGALAGAFSSPWTLPWLARLPLPNVLGWRAKLASFSGALQAAVGSGQTFALLLGLSLVFQGLWLGVNLLLAASLGLPIPALVLALGVPLSDIVGMIPVFWNNLGAREGVLIPLLGTVGVAPAAALALSLLVFLVRLLSSLPGGVFLLKGGGHGASVPSRQDG